MEAVKSGMNGREKVGSRNEAEGRNGKGKSNNNIIALHEWFHTNAKLVIKLLLFYNRSSMN